MAMRIGTQALAVAVILASIALGATPASAAVATPIWAIKSVALPTNFSEAHTKYCEEAGERGCDAYAVTATNVGSVPTSGPITVRERLPQGIAFKRVLNEEIEENGPPELGPKGERIAGEQNRINCFGAFSSVVSCEYGGEGEPPVPPGGVLSIVIQVTTTSGAGSSVRNVVEVEGGGAAPAVSAEVNTVSTAAPAFGVQDFPVSVLGRDGTIDAQAADHPAALYTAINYTTAYQPPPYTNHWFAAVQEPKTSIVSLPLGFVGDPLATGQCPESVMDQIENHPAACASARVGVAQLEFEMESPKLATIYSVVPETGYPAEYGFEFDGAVVLLRARLLPAADGYVLSVAVPDILRPANYKLTGATFTFFGDPSEVYGSGNGEATFTNPSECGAGPSHATLEMDSWVDPERWLDPESERSDDPEGSPTTEASSYPAGVTGCGALRFEPSLEVKPEETDVDTPSGYEVDLKVPQIRNVPGLLATPDLKDAVVSLPEGVAISPSAANGLQACREAGAEGINITHGWTPTGPQPLDPADPDAMEIQADGLPHVAPGHCPKASQIGTVEVKTPLLAEPLTGHVYLAEPQCGGEAQPACTQASATNGELYGLYLEVAGSGAIVKLKGTVSSNPTTGELTTTFRENPQLPFSELKLRLNGGERAPLATPQTCGIFTTTSDLTPWSAPATPDATPFSSFSQAGCASQMPFAPPFSAESLTANAGGSSPFSVTFSRHDGEQDLAGVSVTMPPGLVGLLSEVALCGEAQADADACPEASKIGTTTVAVGSGPAPFWVSGSVYLTGPYDGAPFGLSVVVPAKAGPFNLGNVVVRAAINVSPSTTAVTVTSGAFPQIVDGVPLRMQTVNVLVDRPGFILNPTNCEQQAVTGKIAAAQGAVSSVSSPFAVEGCKNLAFKPSLTASTQGRASKADGASLDVKVTYPKNGEADIRSVKTDLPSALPSRLSTLQKACTAAVFEANPAECPAQAVVGIARASTPVLPVALNGPVYLVSHAGEEFPNIVVVLQGDGVRVDLVGDTDIKKGITSTTFASVPDDPVSSFELYLPEGKYSILGAYLPERAYYDFCGRKLAMPTVITGQNGAVIKQSTTIKVTGCPKAKKAAGKKKTKAKKASRVRKSRHGKEGK
jgi:hypothetical protein